MVRDAQHSDVGEGIKRAVSAPPLIFFPSDRFLLSKSVFSDIFISELGVETWQTGR